MTSLAADLERQRLTFYARRLEEVVAALHERRAERDTSAEVPPPLDLAIADFTDQLTTIQSRLTDEEYGAS